MRSTHAVAILLATLLVLTGGCGGGGGSSGGGGGGTGTGDSAAPLFWGLSCVATAGGAAVRLDWATADDIASPGAFTYDVYAAATSGGQNFAAPIASTGATSLVLTGADSALIAVGARVFLVVRATDAAGNQDTNQVELACTPVAPASVAFASDTAGGTGTLGDATDPFPSVQAGIAAVEGAGGGVVLVDAASGGTVYTEELSLTTTVTSIGLYGGFPRFSTLPAAPTGAQVLATRDLADRETGLSGGNAVLVGGDLITLSNSLSPTDVDGFTLRDLYTGSTPLTGTLHFTNGSHRVTGTGTLFSSEVLGASVLFGTARGIAMDVDVVRSDTELVLETPWTGPTGSAVGALRVGPTQTAVIGTDAALQISCCRFLSGALLDLDTTTVLIGSSLRLVGNSINDQGEATVELDGGCTHLRSQNNDVRFRDRPMVGGTSPVREGEVASRPRRWRPTKQSAATSCSATSSRLFAASRVWT